MLYTLHAIGFYFLKIFPIRVCYFLADIAAFFYYLCAGKDKKILEENLRIVLGEDADEKVIKKNIRGIFRNFARYLADFFKVSKLTEEYINKNVILKGLENLEKGLSRKKGVIAITAHLGNWERGAAIVASLGYPISAIVLEHKDKRINDLFMRQRTIHSVKLIPLGVQLKKCFRVLKENEVLAIAGDKDYTSNGDHVKFFGRTAFIPKGAAFFSLKTDAPLVVTSCTRNEDNTFNLCFDEPIIPERTGNLKSDIRGLMEKYLLQLEKRIREYPDQWYAFQEIWNHEQITQ
ncbi:MAG: lysophospholipid acyltransferase family protein [Candidatus Omnitrophota bacterium]